ncbi:hypothetical protein H0H93_007249 [Arthromyces matolae]|nr:hypothetical protein H0H93_007249 [Arthromyces matolae]
MSTTATSSSFYKDFTPVNRKKRKSKLGTEKLPLFDIVQRLRDELGRDDWLIECQQILSESLVACSVPEEILCLGLGSPGASPNARAQLAFLLAISQHLNIGPEKVSIYDPVFTADDRALFGTLHLNLLPENKASSSSFPTLETRVVIYSPTITYSTHELTDSPRGTGNIV